MQFKSRVMGALLGALVMIQAAVAAPAIQNPNFETGVGWTAVGTGTNDTRFLTNQSNPGILGGDTYGLVVGRGGATSGETRPGFFGDVVYGATSIGQAAPSFGNGATGFADNFRFVGIYQEFETGTRGDISFDAVAFANGNNGTADPFVFLFNTASGAGSFIRGGDVIGSNTFPDAVSSVLLNGANLSLRPVAELTRVIGAGTASALAGGATYTFSNVAAGNWIIGFGYAAPRGSTNYFGGLAISNIVSPNAVPEIDTASAGLPIAIAMLLFFVVSDRRGRKESAVIG